MNTCVVLQHVEILLPADPGTVAGRDARLGQPDTVLFVSSAEIGVLFQPEPTAWVRSIMARHPMARHVFVSMACAGLFAAMLEFARSPARLAHVYLLEIPAHYTQANIDAGGQDAGECMLLAQETVARVVLAKKPPCDLHPDDTLVTDCTILCKPNGINGTHALLLKMRDWLNGHVRCPADWVSFFNASVWSRRLLHGFEQMMLPQCAQLREKLPSVEADSRHWLTVKPVLEYLEHRDRLDERPLVLASLGAGGRVGLLLLGRGGHCAPANAAIGGLAQPYLVPDAPRPVSEPFYCAPQFRSRDNLYFLTELHAARWAQAAAMAADNQTILA